MALENVLDEIISQAENQRKGIIEQGKQEAWKILDQATSSAKEQNKLFEEETSKMLDENKRMEMSALNIKLHKTLLDAKRAILDELSSRLVEQLNKMDTAKRKEILNRLIEKARSELPDAKYVYCRSNDRELVTRLQFKGGIECMGGVIVSNADESIRINYTFDVLLQQTKEAYLNEIAKKIF